MPRPKLCIFDMDGVIVDSMPVLRAEAIRLMRLHYGVTHQYAEEAYGNTVGMPFAQQLANIFPHDTKNFSVATEYEASHRKLAPTFPLSKTAKSVLVLLDHMGISTALVSSTDRSIILNTPQVMELPFRHVEGYIPLKYKDFQIRQVLNVFNVRPQEALFFGDSPEDQRYGRSAEVRYFFAECDGLESHVVSAVEQVEAGR